jgi:hypothetical protein
MKQRVPRNYGRFLSLRAIQDGTNVAFLSVMDILAFQKEQLQSSGRATKAFKRPAVKLSVMLFFNNEVHDLLAQQAQKGKIRFSKQLNRLTGSRNYGHEFEQVVGVQKMEVSSSADITLAIKIAQQAKQTVADKLKVEMT